MLLKSFASILANIVYLLFYTEERTEYLRSTVFSLLGDLRFSAVSAAAIVTSFGCSLGTSALKLLANWYC